MSTPDNYAPDPTESEVDPPPVMGTWRRLYLLVLVLHALFIAGFYLLTRYYS